MPAVPLHLPHSAFQACQVVMANNHGSMKRKRPLLEAVVVDGDSKFARALASVDFHTREKGLQALTLWLSRKADVGELELLKLWKGVFYCFWHSDKAPVQTALAERLGEMMLQLPEQVALLYYSVFFKTLRREWFGIDHLRLDKFLMLIRKFFHHSLLLLQAGGWTSEEVGQYTNIWLHQVLLPSDNLVAAGMAYHLCDLLLPEVEKASGAGVHSSGGPQQPTLHVLLEPFCQALASTRDPALIHRLRQGLFEPLIDALSSQPGSLWQRLDMDKLAAHLFDLGAKQETRAKNREALYAFSAALEKAAKQRQRQAGGQGAAEPRQLQRAGDTGQQQQQKSGRKKKKEERSAEDAGVGAPQAEAVQREQQHGPQPAEPPVANGMAAAPGSGKKAKRERLDAGGKGRKGAGTSQQQQEEEGQAPLEQRAEEQQQPATLGKKAKRRAAAAAAAAAACDGMPQPALGQQEQHAAEPGAAPTTGSKKNVRFALRRNLVMTIGQPPLPEDVRTPPTAKPKGPALKASSLTMASTTPRSAPGRLNNAGKQARSRLVQGGSSKSTAKAAAGPRPLVSPHAVPRVRAADLF